MTRTFKILILLLKQCSLFIVKTLNFTAMQKFAKRKNQELSSFQLPFMHILDIFFTHIFDAQPYPCLIIPNC